MLPNMSLRSLRVDAEAPLEHRQPLLPRLDASRLTSTLQVHQSGVPQAAQHARPYTCAHHSPAHGPQHKVQANLYFKEAEGHTAPGAKLEDGRSPGGREGGMGTSTAA